MVSTIASPAKPRNRLKTFADMRLGAMLALALMYVILAWVFASFSRPFAVMLVIPFGLIGAVLGHMLMGYDLSILRLDRVSWPIRYPCQRQHHSGECDRRQKAVRSIA